VPFPLYAITGHSHSHQLHQNTIYVRLILAYCDDREFKETHSWDDKASVLRRATVAPAEDISESVCPQINIALYWGLRCGVVEVSR
jgi:hypothetical protein